MADENGARPGVRKSLPEPATKSFIFFASHPPIHSIASGIDCSLNELDLSCASPPYFAPPAVWHRAFQKDGCRRRRCVSRLGDTRNPDPQPIHLTKQDMEGSCRHNERGAPVHGDVCNSFFQMHTPASQLTSSSERQYKYRFPGLKNVKEDEWAYIGEEIRSRADAGKLSLACLYKQPLPMSRVSRGIARARIARSGIIKQSSFGMFTANQHEVSESGPLTWVSKENRQRHLHNGRITVRTPPPLSAGLAPSSPNDQQMFDGPQWGVDHGVAAGFSPLAQGSPTVTEGFGALFDFDAASSIGK